MDPKLTIQQITGYIDTQRQLQAQRVLSLTAGLVGKMEVGK